MSIKIGDIMGKSFTSLPEAAHIGLVEAEMATAGVRYVVIVDEHGRLTGIVTPHDMARALDKGARGQVTQYMTRRISWVHPQDEATKAADLLIERQDGVLAVVDDDGKPLGLV